MLEPSGLFIGVTEDMKDIKGQSADGVSQEEMAVISEDDQSPIGGYGR